MQGQKNELSPIIHGLIPGLTEIGKIKIGRKGKFVTSSNGTRFQNPEKLDHFIITKLDRNNDTGNFIEDTELMNKLKERQELDAQAQLKRIPISLLYNDPKLSFQCRYTCYHGRTRWCSGDGMKAHRINETTKKIEVVSCPCGKQDPIYEGQDKCKTASCLSCVIEGADVVGGVWKFRSVGYNSAMGILSALALIYAQTRGILAGIPLDMVVYPKMGSDPKTGEQRKINVVSIEFRGNAQLLRETAHRIALEDSKYGLQITHIEDEARKLISVDAAVIDSDEEAEFAEEFYPEQAEIDPPKPDTDQRVAIDQPPPQNSKEKSARNRKPKKIDQAISESVAETVQTQDETKQTESETEPAETETPPQLEIPPEVMDLNLFGGDE